MPTTAHFVQESTSNTPVTCIEVKSCPTSEQLMAQNTLSTNKFKNHKLEAMTIELEAEFNRIMREGYNTGAQTQRVHNQESMVQGPSHKLTKKPAQEELHDMMGEFYNGECKRH